MESHPHAPTPEELLEHASWIQSLASSLVRDPASAEDLVQDTWIAALRHPQSLAAAPRAWLGTVLRNFARQRARGETSRGRRERESSRVEALPSPDELLERVERQRLLVEAVAALEEPYRTVVVLRYYEGLTAAEIARRQDVPDGRVRSRLMRGLQRLREELDRRHGGDRGAWLRALLPLADPRSPWSIAAGGSSTALATGAFAVKKLILVVGTLAVIAGALVVSRMPERGPPAAGGAAPTASAPSDLEQRPSAATPATAVAPSGGQRVEAAVTDALDARTAIWVAGRVLLPADAPGDATLEVFALSEPLTYRHFTQQADGADAGGSSVLARRPVQADGRFELPFPAGAELGHVMLRGRTLYLSSSIEVELSTLFGELEIEPRCGAWVRGRLLAPVGTQGGVAAVDLELIGDPPELGSTRERAEETLDLTLRTLADGSFELRAIPTGHGHELSALPERLAPRTVRVDGLLACAEQPLDVRLEVGGRVRGHVVDGAGSPVAGARVEALYRRRMLGFGDRVLRETTTDGDGAFALLHLPSDSTELRAEGAGYLDSDRKRLAVADRATVEGLVLVLDEGRALAGTVTWSDGRPAGDVEVVVEFDQTHGIGPTAFNALRGAGGGGRTADDGSFRITGLGGGPFTVTSQAAAPLDPEADPFAARQDGVSSGSSDLRLVLRAPSRLVGRALDQHGAPLEEFRVRALRLVEGAVGATVTHRREEDFADGNGRFELGGLLEGRWRVEAQAEGQVQLEPRVVEMPAEQDEPLTLTLVLAARASGVVLDPLGAPVAGARVRLDTGRSEVQDLVAHLPSPPETRSADDGTFALEGLPPGACELYAVAEGFARGPSVSVDPSGAREGADLVLRLARGGTITGEAYDERGQPVEGHMVHVMRWQIGDVDIRTGRTDARGSFRVENVPPETWMVLVVDAQADFSTDGDRPSAARMMEAMSVQTVNVVEGETHHLVFGSPPADPIVVRGRLSRGDEPYEGAVVTFARRGGAAASKPSIAGSDERGQYETVVDGPGEYSVSLQTVTTGPGQISVLSRTLEVPDEPEVQLDFAIPLGRIAGAVTGPGGAPAASARVTLTSEGGALGGGRYAELRTDFSGAYSIDALEPGTYQLAVGGSSFFGGDTSAPHARSVRSGLRLDEGELLDDVDFALSEPGAIEVWVLDAAGAPVEGAAIFVRDESGTLLEPIAVARTDASGRQLYTGVSPGEVTLRARNEGAASLESTPVRVQSGKTVRAELRLEQGTLLRVRVVDREGEPTAARLRVEDEDGRDLAGLLTLEEAEELMGSGGLDAPERTLGPLPPGSYRVVATANDGRRAAKPVTLAGEDERKLTLRVR